MKTNDFLVRKTKAVAALAILMLGGMSAMLSTAHAQTLSPQVQEIVKLSQAKMSDDVITSYIHNSGTSFNLSADDILYLNTHGVSQPVISALLQARPAAVSAPSTPAPSAPPQNPVSPYPSSYAPAPEPSMPAPDISQAPPSTDISLSYFQSQLAPYGSWVNLPGEGECWVPSVTGGNPGWRPYFNQGHWIYTDDGWSWQSDYPWGQYVFHYGRWTQDPTYGWVWVPGYNWGPGWVAWRNADDSGFCGWAPLPPRARFEVGVGMMWNGQLAVDTDFGLAPDAFVFVPYDHFWAHDYVGFRAPAWRVGILFRASFAANHYGFAGGHFVFEGIGRERMGILTHHDVRVDHLAIRDEHIMRAREVEHTRAVEVHDRGGAGAGNFHSPAGHFDSHATPAGHSDVHGDSHDSSSRGGNSWDHGH
jgi:hypothetical protein